MEHEKTRILTFIVVTGGRIFVTKFAPRCLLQLGRYPRKQSLSKESILARHVNLMQMINENISLKCYVR